MQPEIKKDQIWRHVKRGTLYRVFGFATLQTSTTAAFANLIDNTEMVVYVDLETNKLWVRSRIEFLDGRFTLDEG